MLCHFYIISASNGLRAVRLREGKHGLRHEGLEREVARGLVNYSSSEARRIKRRPSAEIETLLGFVQEPELIHRDNLVLL